MDFFKRDWWRYLATATVAFGIGWWANRPRDHWMPVGDGKTIVNSRTGELVNAEYGVSVREYNIAKVKAQAESAAAIREYEEKRTGRVRFDDESPSP
jgi:hypothetical protein